MDIRRVWAVYFSPTGATRTAAGALAKALARRLAVPVETHDFTLPPAREKTPAFSAAELVIFGTPVYAGRVPNLLVNYIASFRGSGALCVPLVTYGNRAFDDALMELSLLLQSGGFRPLAGCAFVGEHSFGRSLAADRPDRDDLAAARGFALEIYKKLSALETGEAPKPLTLPGNNPVGPWFRPADREGNFIDIRRVKPIADARCIDCGLCAEFCPMGSISHHNVHEVSGVCIKCNACVKSCPAEARRFTDPGYLYHRNDILSRYAFPRKAPQLFL